MADEVRLRSATPADVEAVRALLAAADLPLEGLEDQFGDGYVLAERAGRVVAAEGIEVYGDDGLLRSAVVDAALRGRGLGERLTRERLDWARRRGLRAVWLLTTTAAPFFDRLGFARVERASAPPALQASREFATVCPSSAACMRLPLS